ncbi:MAG: PspA/IM30 family protein [Myxococcota bacterium]
MGLFSRLGALLKSNVNDLISKAEDPEKMLNQMLLDMQGQLIEAKKQVAVAIADEKKLKKQLDTEAMAAAEWEKKAMLALKAGNEGLAREALARQQEHAKLAEGFQVQWDGQRQAVEQLKNALQQLNGKIDEAKRKKNLLVARAKRAEAQQTIANTMHGLQDTSAFETMARMEEKINQLEAQTEAHYELAAHTSGDALEEKFKQLGAASGTDDALAALKAKMGMLPSASTAGQLGPARSTPSEDAELEGELDTRKKP